MKISVWYKKWKCSRWVQKFVLGNSTGSSDFPKGTTDKGEQAEILVFSAESVSGFFDHGPYCVVCSL